MHPEVELADVQRCEAPRSPGASVASLPPSLSMHPRACPPARASLCISASPRCLCHLDLSSPCARSCACSVDWRRLHLPYHGHAQASAEGSRPAGRLPLVQVPAKATLLTPLALAGAGDALAGLNPHPTPAVDASMAQQAVSSHCNEHRPRALPGCAVVEGAGMPGSSSAQILTLEPLELPRALLPYGWPAEAVLDSWSAQQKAVHWVSP
mmetsp:Transcript_71626/g.180754  ORF Transcript_71626/g.180754 Transcript_71626/m.180754 type:complete len:210 (+) Transcript_71626:405-1034(+)